MKKSIIFSTITLFSLSLYGFEGTSKVDEVLRQLTKQYEADQAAKSKLEREKFELDAKTAELNNQKTIKELLKPTAIIKVGDEHIIFLQTAEDVFVRLSENQTYKDFKITKIDSNGFSYDYKGDKGYLPIEISSKIIEAKK